MQTIQAKESPVITKTRELCEVLVSQDSFKRLKAQVDAFLADPKSQGQYQDLSELQSHLVGKQRSGMTLSQQEIDDFETARRELMANTVASGFIEAQRLMEKLQEEISAYVQLAFELGRAPTPVITQTPPGPPGDTPTPTATPVGQAFVPAVFELGRSPTPVVTAPPPTVGPTFTPPFEP